MSALEDETLKYLLATVLLFGLPLGSFFVWLRFDEYKSKNKSREESDREFLEKYGQNAYNTLLKNRALLKEQKDSLQATAATGAGAPFSSVANTATAGVWFSKTTAQALLELVELNHQEALIGQSPHRLDRLTKTGTNQLILQGSWPYPMNPELNTTCKLELLFQAQSATKSAVKYKYKVDPKDDPIAKQIIELTNFWLENLIKKERS